MRVSSAAELAAYYMESTSAQFFHDHVLVKEPGTQKPTPWHSVMPYYFIAGQQTISFWIPVDPVKEATLRLLAGSHRWGGSVRPVRWQDLSSFYDKDHGYRAIPDPGVEPAMKLLEWDRSPGNGSAMMSATLIARGARPRHFPDTTWRPASACAKTGSLYPGAPLPARALRPGSRA